MKIVAQLVQKTFEDSKYLYFMCLHVWIFYFLQGDSGHKNWLSDVLPLMIERNESSFFLFLSFFDAFTIKSTLLKQKLSSVSLNIIYINCIWTT